MDLAFFLFPLSTLALGMLSGLITSKRIPTWYKFLSKPPLTPPNFIFPVMWTLLYLLIGVSAALVHASIGFDDFRRVWTPFFLQYALNLVWTPLFFGLNWVFLAGIEIVVMEIAICWNMVIFWTVTKSAGMLLIPYCVWVGFACYLNWGIYVLNRGKASKKE